MNKIITVFYCLILYFGLVQDVQWLRIMVYLMLDIEILWIGLQFFTTYNSQQMLKGWISLLREEENPITNSAVILDIALNMVTIIVLLWTSHYSLAIVYSIASMVSLHLTYKKQLMIKQMQAEQSED